MTKSCRTTILQPILGPGLGINSGMGAWPPLMLQINSLFLYRGVPHFHYQNGNSKRSYRKEFREERGYKRETRASEHRVIRKGKGSA